MSIRIGHEGKSTLRLAVLACAIAAGGCSSSSKGSPTPLADAAPAAEAGAEAGVGGGVEGGAEAGSDLVVTVADGPVQADIVGGVRRFLKIPYAQPPLGDLRWKAPMTAPCTNLPASTPCYAPWTVVRHETMFSSGCPQSASMQGPASMNEDCLYLNVWAPEPAPTKAAVMVWFHGGGNFAGSTADDVPLTNQLWYDGQFFAARHGVIVVSTNYRLGPMGFFSHPGLSAEGSPLGNQGLFDQRAALKWVQKNIAAFGGDPTNVTIFGESAGSADVCYHVVSGEQGLFERAISESGGCSGAISGGKERTAAEAAMEVSTFTKMLGCDTAMDQLACLRSKSVSDILTNSPQPDLTGGMSVRAPFAFGVVVDGPGGFLSDQPRTLLDNGQFNKVPYILGSNNDEGMLFVLNATIPTSDAEYLTALQNNFGGFAPQVMAEYPVSNFNGDYRVALARAIGDSGLVCGTHDTARRVQKGGAKVFMYNFNVAWAIDPTQLMASHASEISHVFGDPVMPSPSPDSQKVSDAMNAFWAHFAQTGDPNVAGSPATWPAFTPDANDNDVRLQLDPQWEMVQNFRKAECEFWRGYYDQAFAGTLPEAGAGDGGAGDAARE